MDGELAAEEEREVETHLAGCSECRREFSLQKAFMFELTRSLEHPAFVDVPEDFTRSVVANAENRVTGLRKPGERSRALVICAGLLVVATIGLGGDFLGLFGSGAVKGMAIADVGLHIFHDLSTSVAVLLRSVSSKVLFGSALSIGFVAAVFAGSLFICARLNPRDR